MGDGEVFPLSYMIAPDGTVWLDARELAELLRVREREGYAMGEVAEHLEGEADRLSPSVGDAHAGGSEASGSIR